MRINASETALHYFFVKEVDRKTKLNRITKKTKSKPMSLQIKAISIRLNWKNSFIESRTYYCLFELRSRLCHIQRLFAEHICYIVFKIKY